MAAWPSCRYTKIPITSSSSNHRMPRTYMTSVNRRAREIQKYMKGVLEEIAYLKSVQGTHGPSYDYVDALALKIMEERYTDAQSRLTKVLQE